MIRKSFVMAAAAVVSFVFAACGGGGGGGTSGGITTSTCTSANISGTRTTGISADVAYAAGTTDAITTGAGWFSSSASKLIPSATGVTPQISWSGSAASIIIQRKVNISGSMTYDPVYVVDGAGGGNLPAPPYTYGKAAGVVVELVLYSTSAESKADYRVLPNGDYQAVVIRKTTTNDYDCKNFTVTN